MDSAAEDGDGAFHMRLTLELVDTITLGFMGTGRPNTSMYKILITACNEFPWQFFYICYKFNIINA